MKNDLKLLDEEVLPHWSDIIKDPIGIPCIREACAFCQAHPNCKGCPIYVRGNMGCLSTPWEEFVAAKDDLKYGLVTFDQIRDLAKDEYKFLDEDIRKFIKEGK